MKKNNWISSVIMKLSRHPKTSKMDLTNWTQDEINNLTSKYLSLLKLIKDKEQIPFYAVIIDIGSKYIKEKYGDLHIDWKAWGIVTLKKLSDFIKNETDIRNIIDDFIGYYRTEYMGYLENAVTFSSEYDRDSAFVNIFVRKAGELNSKIHIK